MCQATIYLGDKQVAEEVTSLEPVAEGVRITAFFEEPQIVPGKIRHIDFLKHRVLLDPLEQAQNE